MQHHSAEISPAAAQAAASAFVLLVLAGAFFFLMPDTTKHGGMIPNVLRNWQQHGLSTLGVRLVMNPGGSGLPETVMTYPGHQGAYLLPVFGVQQLFASESAGKLAFFLLLSAGMIFSVWVWLGGTWMGLMVAACFLCCPGYFRQALAMDPLSLPVLFGIFYIAGIVPWLRRGPMGWARWCFVVLTTLIFVTLNWTVSYVLLPIYVYLLAAARKPSRDLLGYILLSGLLLAGVTALLIRQKMETPTGGSDPSLVQNFYDTYFYGARGYGGYGMDWSRALLRFAVVLPVSLLPLLVAAAWWLFKSGCDWRLCARILAPAAAAVLCGLVMRNFFAHHPWFLSPVTAVGIVLSLRLLYENSAPTTLQSRKRWIGLGVAAAAAYAFFMILLLRVNSLEEQAVFHMVQKATGRGDLLLISAEADPDLAARKLVWELLLDRPIREWPDALAISTQFPSAFLLASAPLTGKVPRAETSPPSEMDLALLRVVEWYRQKIAQRSREDRFIPGKLYLYPAQ